MHYSSTGRPDILRPFVRSYSQNVFPGVCVVWSVTCNALLICLCSAEVIWEHRNPWPRSWRVTHEKLSNALVKHPAAFIHDATLAMTGHSCPRGLRIIWRSEIHRQRLFGSVVLQWSMSESSSMALHNASNAGRFGEGSHSTCQQNRTICPLRAALAYAWHSISSWVLYAV